MKPFATLRMEGLYKTEKSYDLSGDIGIVVGTDKAREDENNACTLRFSDMSFNDCLTMAMLFLRSAHNVLLWKEDAEQSEYNSMNRGVENLLYMAAMAHADQGEVNSLVRKHLAALCAEFIRDTSSRLEIAEISAPAPLTEDAQ